VNGWLWAGQRELAGAILIVALAKISHPVHIIPQQIAITGRQPVIAQYILHAGYDLVELPFIVAAR